MSIWEEVLESNNSKAINEVQIKSRTLEKIMKPQLVKQKAGRWSPEIFWACMCQMASVMLRSKHHKNVFLHCKEIKERENEALKVK